MKKLLLVVALGFSSACGLKADVKLPAIFSDHMVLQQKIENRVWGWDNPGSQVTVSFAGQNYTATAAADGKWLVKLSATPANATGQTLTISGTSKRVINDVVVGEVWMCSGQSNMGFQLRNSYTGDIEAARANSPLLRLITVPVVGTQELQTDFKGEWKIATPQTAASFSAVGFLFGRYLQDILGVPVGLINNSWGGSAAEAWVRRQSLEADPRFASLMESTRKQEAHWSTPEGRAQFEKSLADWKVRAEKARAEKKTVPTAPVDYLTNKARPGNIFAGMVHPTLGYGIKGVIWYQGETNVERAAEYRDLFPYLIEQWRKEQAQGDFPFYWVQLADFKAEQAEPKESSWAELREAQTMTLKLPNTGQAVIIDVGEGRDIHPRNKYAVASRLVRWALAKDYGHSFPYHSAEFQGVSFANGKATVKLNCFGSALRAFDTEQVRGFAICGQDRQWRWATAKIVDPDTVEVSSPDVTEPTAVRYAWADNPVCNLYTMDGLPVTPFRTDAPAK